MLRTLNKAFGLNSKLHCREISEKTGMKLRAYYRRIAILMNLPGHLKLLELMNLPHASALKNRYPHIVYKYLNSYLARSFKRKTRLKILMNHYRYMNDRVNENFLKKIFDDGQLLWQECIDGQSYGITLAFPKTHDHEGDLVLIFEANSAPLYLMSFSIVEGLFVDINTPQTLLVTRIQGSAGNRELIKQATKACRDIAPVYLLLAATEGIALSLDIKMIVGLGKDQILSGKWVDPDIHFNYDEFWKSFCGEQSSKNFYAAPVPFEEKSIKLIKANHRSRTLRKREMRNQISEQVRACFKENFLINKEDG